MSAHWLAVARKDVVSELRSRDTLLALVLLALLVGASGLLAFHDLEERAVVASALVWIALAFAASLGLARAFGAERDRGTLDALLALPMERASVYAGKALSSLVVLALTAAVVVPLYFVASGDPLPARWAPFLAFIGLGCVGLAAVGATLSAVAAQTRSRDLLLPVLLLPLVVPLLISGIHGTQDVLRDLPFAQWRPELLLLLGYDVAFLAAGALVADQAVAA